MNRRELIQSSSLGVSLVLGIALTLNVLGHFAHLRLDFSRGRVYSISAASKKLVRGLPDPVQFKLYYSKELPPQIAVNRDYARDLLGEYRAAGGSKVHVKLVEVDAGNKEDALRDGVAPVRFDIIARDKYEQREGFFGLVLQYRDKKEVIPYLQEVDGLEYDLTSRVKTLTLPEKPSLAFVTSRKALGPEALPEPVRAKLEGRYALRSLDLASVPDDGIAADVQTLLLLGPEERFSDRELWLLDQYLASGRSLGVALDTQRVDLRAFSAADNDTGLGPWLERHGVKVLPTLVLDAQSQPIQISMQQGMFVMTNVVQYPPFVIANDLSPGHPVTKGLDSVVLPFASPLELHVKDPAAKTAVLARSSKFSWAKPPNSGPTVIHPFRLQGAQASDLRGPFGLAAATEASFEPTEPRSKGLKAKVPLSKASRPGRLAVIGSSKLIAESFRVPGANYVFLLNLADWLALDAELIAIRNKTVAFKPLKEIPAGAKAAVRYLLIFAPPLLATLAGLARWRARGKQRLRRVAAFGPPAAAPPPGAAPPPAAEPEPEPVESGPPAASA